MPRDGGFSRHNRLPINLWFMARMGVLPFNAGGMFGIGLFLIAQDHTLWGAFELFGSCVSIVLHAFLHAHYFRG